MVTDKQRREAERALAAYDVPITFIDTGTILEDSDGSLLNEHGKYVVKYAKNHGISIAEAQEAPMVKAHLQYFCSKNLIPDIFQPAT